MPDCLNCVQCDTSKWYIDTDSYKPILKCTANMRVTDLNPDTYCPLFRTAYSEWYEALKASDHIKETLNNLYGINSITKMEEPKMIKGTILDKNLDTVFENIKTHKKMMFISGYENPNVYDIDTMSVERIRINLKRNDTILLLIEKEGEDEE